MNLFKKLFLNLVVFCGVVSGVWAQTTPCNSNSEEMKNLRATQFSHFPKVTVSEQGLIYLDTARRDGYANYTATNDVTGAVYTGVFDTTLGVVVVNVGALTQDATFTIKAEKGACSYTLAEKAVFQIATQPELVARVSHEYCANGGGIYYHLVGGANPADYDVKMHRFGAEVTIPTDGIPATRAGEFILKATPKNGGDVLEVRGEVLDKQKRIVYSAKAVPSTTACSNKGDIVFDVTEGSFPMRYEILTGPEVRPLQDSPEFKDLPAGTYTVRVTDFCATGGGQAAPTTVVIASKIDFTGSLHYMSFINKQGSSACLDNEFINKADIRVAVNEEIFEKDNYNYPFVLKRRFESPSGQEYLVSNTITKKQDLLDLVSSTYYSSPNEVLIFKPLTGITTTEHTGDWKIKFWVESCGSDHTIFETTKALNEISYVNYYRPKIRTECGVQTRNWISSEIDWTRYYADNVGAYGWQNQLLLDEFPACYNPLANGFYKENGQWIKDDNSSNPTIDNICQGQFVWRVKNQCGALSQPYTMNIGNLVAANVDYTNPSSGQGSIRCEDKRNVYIYAGHERGNQDKKAVFSKITLTSFTNGDVSQLPNGITIPHEFTQAVGQTTFSLTDSSAMPPGDYVFEIQYYCDTKTYNLPIKVEKPTRSNITWDYTTNCVLSVNIDNRGSHPNQYYLQWFSEETNSWVYPKRVKPTNDADANRERFRIYQGQTIVFDDDYYKQGNYRIVTVPDASSNCVTEVSDFKLPAVQIPDITSVVGIKCTGNIYRVGIMVKGGKDPYKYFLVEEGHRVLPTPKPADDGNVFFDIDGSDPNKVYKFRVEDQCGGANTREIAIALLAPFQIQLDTPTNCLGGTATLSVPAMSILKYEWYDKNNPTQILSRENALVLNNLTTADFAKTYAVRVTSKSGTDICVNKELEQQLTLDPNGAVDLTGTSDNIELCISEIDQSANRTLYSNFNLKEKLFPRAPDGGVIVDKEGLIPVPANGIINVINLKESFRGKEVTFEYQYTNACGLVSKVEAKVLFKNMVTPYYNNMTICSGETQPKSLNDITRELIITHAASGLNSVQWFKDSARTQAFSTAELAAPLNPTSSTTYYAKASGTKNCFNDFSFHITVKPPIAAQDETFDGCDGMTALDLKNKLIQKLREAGRHYSDSSIKLFLRLSGNDTQMVNRHQLNPIREEYWYQIEDGSCLSQKHQLTVNLSDSSLVSNYTMPTGFTLTGNNTVEICESNNFTPLVFKAEGTNLRIVWERVNPSTGRWEEFTEGIIASHQGNEYIQTFTPNKDTYPRGGYYSHRVKFIGCDEKTTNFSLAVLPQLNSTWDYAERLLCKDSSISLYAPSNSGNITYEWYRNTTNSVIGATKIANATSSYINITYIDAGEYYYFVKMKYTNPSVAASCPEVTTQPKKITMIDQSSPTTSIGSFDMGGYSQEYCLNEDVTLRPIHRNADPNTTYLYQWYKIENGREKVIDGATNLEYKPNTTVITDYVTYRLKASTCNSSTSNDIRVKITDFKGTISFDDTDFYMCFNTSRTITASAYSGASIEAMYEGTDDNIANATLLPNTTTYYNIPADKAEGVYYYFVRFKSECGVEKVLKKKVIISKGDPVALDGNWRSNWVFCKDENATIPLNLRNPMANYSYVWEKYNQTTQKYEPIAGQTSSTFQVPTSEIGDTNYRVAITGCDSQYNYFSVRIGNNPNVSITPNQSTMTICSDNFELYARGGNIPYNNTFTKFKWFAADTDDITQATELIAENNDYHFPTGNNIAPVSATQTQNVRYYFLMAYNRCDDTTGTYISKVEVTKNQPVIDLSDYKPDSCDNNLTPKVVVAEIKRRLQAQGLNPDDFNVRIHRREGNNNYYDITDYAFPEPNFNPTTSSYAYSITNLTAPHGCNGVNVKMDFAPITKKRTKITKPLGLVSKNLWCLGEEFDELSVEVESENNANVIYRWYLNDAIGQRILLEEGKNLNKYRPVLNVIGDYMSFEVEVEGECGKDSSVMHTINVAAPKPNLPKYNQTHFVCENTGVRLELFMGNAEGYTFKWYENTTNSNQGGTLIPGEIWSSYYITPAQVGTYYYYAEVTSQCGETVASDVFEITVSNTTEVLPATNISYCDVSELDSGMISTRMEAAVRTSHGFVHSPSIFDKADPTTPIYFQELDPTKEYEFEFFVGNSNCPKRIPITFSATASILTQPKPVKHCSNTYASIIAVGSNPMATYKWFRNTTNSTAGAEELPYTDAILEDSIDNIVFAGQNQAYVFAEISDACGNILTTDIVLAERVDNSTINPKITRYVRKDTEKELDLGTYAGLDYVYLNFNPTIVELLDFTPKVKGINLGKTTIAASSLSGNCSNLIIETIVWDIKAKADEYLGNSKRDTIFANTIVVKDTLNDAENPSLTEVKIKVTPNTATAVTGSTTQFKLLQQDPTTNAPMATQPAIVPVLDTTTGKVTLPKGTPSGTYTLKYQLGYQPDANEPEVGESNEVEVKVVVTNPIEATDDSFTKDKDDKTINGDKTTYTPSVLDTDKFNDDTFKNVPENKSNITLSVVEGATPLTTGAKVPTLVITPATGSTEEVGQIKVEEGTPAGTYTIKYKICENGASPANCKEATATIVVTAPEIVAEPNKYTTDPDDNTSPIIGNKETTLPSILDNDKLNDNELDTNEEKKKVKIEVKTGTTTPVTGSTTEVKLLQEGVTTQPDKAPVLNTKTGVIVVPQGTPAGTYTLKYSICEVLNATNCSKEVEVKVVVTALEIVATENHFTQNPADNTKPISSKERTELPSILNDDTLGGKLLDGKPNNLSADKVKIEVETGTATELPSGNYTLTPPSGVTTTTLPVLNTSTGVIVVPQGTPAGTYTLRYRISEVLNPSNQSVFVDVSVVVDKIVTTPITKVVGRDKGDNFSILDNIKVDNQTPNISNITITDTTTPTSTGKTPKLDSATGNVVVEEDTPAGEYDLTYKVCTTEGLCTTGTIKVKVIEANNDSITNVNGNQNNPDVLDILGGTTPDKVGTSLATLDTNADNGVTIKVVPTASSPTQDETGIAVKLTPADTKFDTTKPYPTLNTETGKVSVPQGTPAGTYTLKYQICREGVCDEAEVSVEVKGINANPDIFKNINGTTGTDNAGNVVTNNDMLNGGKITDITKVAISVLTPATPNTGSTSVPTLDTTTGIVSVPAGTPSGDYTIKYQICDVANAGRCSDAEVKVEVRNPIVATNDRVTIDGNKGGTSVSVLGNDTLSGTTPSIKTQVDISVVTPATSVVGAKNDLVPTLKIDTDKDTAQVEVPQGTPKGTYTITYRICERNADPENCKDATITIEVTGDCELTFYNAISTNGDASNDTFVIEGIECYPDNELKIFNRWGVLVYEQKGYDQSFRGYSNGRVTINRDEPLPNGTYYYIFEYRNSEGETKRKAGWLYKSN